MAPGSVNLTALGLPWSSSAIPDWTLAPTGSMTPGGSPAVFRSSPHAWFAIRLAYLAECTDLPSDAVAEREAYYRRAWEDYVELCAVIVAVADAIADDIERAAALWNTIDQPAADDAFTAVLGEREPFPTTNLVNVAAKHFAWWPPAESRGSSAIGHSPLPTMKRPGEHRRKGRAEGAGP